MSVTVRVWDLPTRLFHWTLVLCFVALVVTGQVGGAWMDWHFRLGYVVLSLLIFRLVWGFVGGYWSRFARFVYTPATVGRYLRGQSEPQHLVGHSPLGAWAVFVILLMLALQVASGLISDDEIATSGPLAQFVSSVWVNRATFYHKEIGKTALLVLAVLHLAAIAFYAFKKRVNLTRAMLTGDKQLAQAVPHSRDDKRSRTYAALIWAAAMLLVMLMLTFAA